LTLRLVRRIVSIIDSHGFVLASVRVSDPVTPRRVMVSVSSSPSLSEAAAPVVSSERLTASGHRKAPVGAVSGQLGCLLLAAEDGEDDKQDEDAERDHSARRGLQDERVTAERGDRCRTCPDRSRARAALRAARLRSARRTD
jgi:hypothetical protein